MGLTFSGTAAPAAQLSAGKKAAATRRRRQNEVAAQLSELREAVDQLAGLS
nr:hypothetical protein [Pirellulales bacterium]